MDHGNTFTIDKINGDERYLCVDVEGLGTVIIESPYKTELNGMVAEVFRFRVVDEPVASTWAHINDLFHPNLIEEVDYGNQNSSSVSSNHARTRKITGGTE